MTSVQRPPPWQPWHAGRYAGSTTDKHLVLGGTTACLLDLRCGALDSTGLAKHVARGAKHKELSSQRRTLDQGHAPDHSHCARHRGAEVDGRL